MDFFKCIVPADTIQSRMRDKIRQGLMNVSEDIMGQINNAAFRGETKLTHELTNDYTSLELLELQTIFTEKGYRVSLGSSLRDNIRYMQIFWEW